MHITFVNANECIKKNLSKTNANRRRTLLKKITSSQKKELPLFEGSQGSEPRGTGAPGAAPTTVPCRVSAARGQFRPRVDSYVAAGGTLSRQGTRCSRDGKSAGVRRHARGHVERDNARVRSAARGAAAPTAREPPPSAGRVAIALTRRGSRIRASDVAWDTVREREVRATTATAMSTRFRE